MIHVCFGLHDKTGHYSKFTGTTMLSLLENINTPPQSTTVHILHDNTLTAENRDKFILIADRYGQSVKFYNVEELCKEELSEITRKISSARSSYFTIAAYYRTLIPDVLSSAIEKCIYLDSDIVVNMDIKELWQIDLGQRILGVVTSKSDDRRLDYNLCIEGIVKFEDYFNSGVLLMNMVALRQEKKRMFNALDFLATNPQFTLLADQDLLNYCFSTQTLKLPPKFNQVVLYSRIRGKLFADKVIYHFAGAGLGLDLNDPFNRLWMDYFIKTPWFNAETIDNIYKFNKKAIQDICAEHNNSMIKLSATMSGKTRAFIVLKSELNRLVENFSVKSKEEILVVESGAPLQKLLDIIKTSRGEKVFFIMAPNFPFQILTEAGFVYGEDFLDCFKFLSNIKIHPYPLIRSM